MKAKQPNKKAKRTESSDDSTAEQVSAKESLRRMKAFIERKENFVAAIKKSKN